MKLDLYQKAGLVKFKNILFSLWCVISFGKPSDFIRGFFLVFELNKLNSVNSQD
jgi:hypothetical protein